MMSGVGTLAGEKYISLTTFKQDGNSRRDAGLGCERRRAPVARVDGSADLEGEAAAARSPRGRLGV
jgi:hypothetical protein